MVSACDLYVFGSWRFLTFVPLNFLVLMISVW